MRGCTVCAEQHRCRIKRHPDNEGDEICVTEKKSDLKWAKKIKIGSRLPARVLWTSQEDKRSALTLLPHLVGCSSFAPPPSAWRPRGQLSTRA